MASIDSPANPALVGTSYSARSPASPSHIRELAVKPPHLQAALVGASLAAALALVAVVVRARSRRRARSADTGSGVFGTILKSSLLAAAQTVVKLGATRLAAKALHRDNDTAPLGAASQ